MPKKIQKRNQKFKCSSQALSQNENAFSISLHTSWFNINILANFLALKVFNLMIFALAECVCKYKFSTFLMSLSIFSFCTYCGSFYCRSGAPSRRSHWCHFSRRFTWDQTPLTHRKRKMEEKVKRKKKKCPKRRKEVKWSLRHICLMLR